MKKGLNRSTEYENRSKNRENKIRVFGLVYAQHMNTPVCVGKIMRMWVSAQIPWKHNIQGNVLEHEF